MRSRKGIGQTRLLWGLSLVTVAVAVIVLFSSVCRCEILPTKGKFKGIYHVGRDGVARFRWLTIPKSFHPQMAPFDGKYIELEMVKGRRGRMGMGPVTLEKIGAVREIPRPPLEIDIQPMAHLGGAPKIFDILVRVGNPGKKAITIDIRDVWLGCGKGESASYHMVRPLTPGAYVNFYATHTRLLPGESVPLVWHSVERPPGEYEIAASLVLRRKDGGLIPYAAWRNLDVGRDRVVKHLKKLKSKLQLRGKVVKQEAEWMHLSAALVNLAKEKRYIFVKARGARLLIPALIQAWDAGGKSVSCHLDWPEPDGPWHRRLITRDGIKFSFALRHSNLFDAAAISRITLWAVTDRGLEKFTVVDRVQDKTIGPMPPWGPADAGRMCRIRMAKPSFAPDEQIRFFFQARATGEAIPREIFRLEKGQRPKNIRIEIDGKPIPLGTTTGLSDEINYGSSFQVEFRLPRELKLSPGTHRVKVSVRCDGGIFEDTTGKKWKKFRGTLVSNGVEFEVAKR